MSRSKQKTGLLIALEDRDYLLYEQREDVLVRTKDSDSLAQSPSASHLISRAAALCLCSYHLVGIGVQGTGAKILILWLAIDESNKWSLISDPGVLYLQTVSG